MGKPTSFAAAGITKQELLSRMTQSGDPKLVELARRIRGVKGWRVDDVWKEVCRVLGLDPAKELERL